MKKVTYLEDSYDPSNEVKAFEVANNDDKMTLGVIYKQFRPTYDQIIDENVTKRAQALSNGTVPIDSLLEQFRP